MEEPRIWQDLLPENKRVFLLCTATTALLPPDGKCIGVWYYWCDNDGKTGRDCLVRDLSECELAQGSEYHKITPEFVRRHGMTKQEFCDKCIELFGSGTLLTFNPKFQARWLPVEVGHLHDLPLLLKGAEMRLALPEEAVESLARAEAFFLQRTGAPKLDDTLRWHGCITEAAEFPVEERIDGLCRLFALWKRQELLVQEQ